MKIPGLSFSWKRALGITQAKQKIARATGIPMSKQGLERKIGSAILKGAKRLIKQKKLFNKKESLDDNLKTLAKLNGEDILYRFFTSDGDEHCVVRLTKDDYLTFE